MKTWLASHLAAFAAVTLLSGNAQGNDVTPAPDTAAEEIGSRGLSIGGCEIKYKNMAPDFDALKSCIKDKIDKIRDDAEKATDAAKAQAQGLQAELNNLKSNPFLAKLEGERRMLEAVRQLKLEPFFQCLAAAKIPQADFSLHIQRITTDPSKYAADMVNEMFDLVERDIQGLLGEHMQALMSPGGLSDPSAVADRSLRTFTRLAGQHPVSRCALQTIPPPFVQLKESALPLISAIKTRVQRIVDKSVSPVLYEALGKKLGPILTNVTMLPRATASSSGRTGSASPQQEPLLPAAGQIRPRGIQSDSADAHDDPTSEITSRGIPGTEYLPDLWGVQMIALGVTAEHYARNLNLVTPKLRALTQALGDPSRTPAALTDLTVALRQSQSFGNDFLFDMGWEILRFAGHKYLDSYCPSSGCGGDLFDTATDILLLAKDTVINGEEAVCSLADIIGGVACGVESEIVDGYYDLVLQKSLKFALVQAAHQGFDQVMDMAKTPVKSGLNPNQNKAFTGRLAELNAYLPKKESVVKLAVAQAGDLMEAIAAHQESVRILAEAAARR